MATTTMAEKEISNTGLPCRGPTQDAAEKHETKAEHDVVEELGESSDQSLESQIIDSPLPLPSRARTIALVITLTGVSI